jgi:hypothetical protein
MQENLLIKKNILQYIENTGITGYKFYKETRITRGILDQNNGMSEENIVKFLAYASDISIDWLLTGKREMLKKVEQSINGIGGNLTISHNDFSALIDIQKRR